MKASKLVEVITDSVTDAVREVLPKLIGAEVHSRFAALVSPELERFSREHAALHDRLTDMQADFATRSTAQCDALASSWHAQVEALRTAITEQVAAQLTKAVAAMPASPGPPGPPGAPGRAGRDATFTPPVHYKGGTIYERGALVQHRGGVWFANVETDAEPGEACSGFSLVLDGCEPLRVEAWGDAGELALVFRYASGVTRAIPLGFRPMQHVGIYDHGRAYLGNDVVTCDGSLWLAREKSANVKPGTDEGRDVWRLIVKRGKDGRDGAPGPRGEQGLPGVAAPAPRAARKVNGAGT